MININSSKLNVCLSARCTVMNENRKLEKDNYTLD